MNLNLAKALKFKGLRFEILLNTVSLFAKVAFMFGIQ